MPVIPFPDRRREPAALPWTREIARAGSQWVLTHRPTAISPRQRQFLCWVLDSRTDPTPAAVEMLEGCLKAARRAGEVPR